MAIQPYSESSTQYSRQALDCPLLSFDLPFLKWVYNKTGHAVALLKIIQSLTSCRKSFSLRNTGVVFFWMESISSAGANHSLKLILVMSSHQTNQAPKMEMLVSLQMVSRRNESREAFRREQHLHAKGIKLSGKV